MLFRSNTYYGLKGDGQLDKGAPLVQEVKKWVDAEYASGRVTVLTDEELVEEIGKICERLGVEYGKFKL